MIGPLGGSGPGWYYKGKHYDAPQELHEAMNADIDRLELQVDGLQKENVNLREAIRGELEKNAVVSQWLVEEGDKLKESNRLNSEYRKALEQIANISPEGFMKPRDTVIDLVDLAREALADKPFGEAALLRGGPLDPDCNHVNEAIGADAIKPKCDGPHLYNTIESNPKVCLRCGYDDRAEKREGRS